jgi:hypothetical protein
MNGFLLTFGYELSGKKERKGTNVLTITLNSSVNLCKDESRNSTINSIDYPSLIFWRIL